MRRKGKQVKEKRAASRANRQVTLEARVETSRDDFPSIGYLSVVIVVVEGKEKGASRLKQKELEPKDLG